MKKLVSAIVLLCILFSLASCGGNNDKTATTQPQQNVYESIVFESIKTFTEVAGVPLNKAVAEKTYETTFEYIVFEDATGKIASYKTYLSEAGFTMTSDVSDKKTVFELNGNAITIEDEAGNNGTIIKITIPCDEATRNERNESFYNELTAAVENKNYKKAYEIVERYDGEDAKTYKDVFAYRQFSIAMINFEKYIYSDARRFFLLYLERDPEDKLGAAEYITECENKTKKYAGTYKSNGFIGGGYLTFYMYINEYGGVTMDTSPYEDGDKIFYGESLRIQEYDNGHVDIAIVYATLVDFEYKFDFIESGDEIIIHDINYDVTSLQVDKTPFAGVYTKISNEFPAENY